MRTLRPVLLAAPLLLAACGDLFFVQADAREVCSTRQSQSFPGSPIGFRFDPPAFSFPLDLAEFAGLLPDDQVEGTVQLGFVELTSGGLDLDRLETVSVRLHPQGSTTPELAVDYTRPAGGGGASGGVLRLEAGPEDRVTLSDLDRQPTWEVTVNLGELDVPSSEWTITARACTEVEARLEYLE